MNDQQKKPYRIEVFNRESGRWEELSYRFPTATAASNYLHARQMTGARVVRAKG